MAAETVTPNLLPREPVGAGFGWRIAVSILSVFGLVSFVLLYFAFWAGAFSASQSAVLVVVTILVFVAANGAAWASWGTRYARFHPY
jgi:hypothetical protein